MDKEVLDKLQELIDLIRERNEGQNEFQARLLEEFRAIHRTLNSMEARRTVGDL